MSLLIRAFQLSDSKSLSSRHGPTKKGNSRVGTSAEAVPFLAFLGKSAKESTRYVQKNDPPLEWAEIPRGLGMLAAGAGFCKGVDLHSPEPL